LQCLIERLGMRVGADRKVRDGDVVVEWEGCV